MGSFQRMQHNARELVAKGATLLDVRTSEEFCERHLPGAANIPVQELSVRLHELPAGERPVVVYCRSGGRSAMAAELLTRAGHQVLDIGAMDNW